LVPCPHGKHGAKSLTSLFLAVAPQAVQKNTPPYRTTEPGCNIYIYIYTYIYIWPFLVCSLTPTPLRKRGPMAPWAEWAHGPQGGTWAHGGPWAHWAHWPHGPLGSPWAHGVYILIQIPYSETNENPPYIYILFIELGVPHQANGIGGTS